MFEKCEEQSCEIDGTLQRCAKRAKILTPNEAVDLEIGIQNHPNS